MIYPGSLNTENYTTHCFEPSTNHSVLGLISSDHSDG